MSHLSILYLEDHIEIQNNIASYLTQNGYTVYSADNVEDGCDLFRSNDIDIVLTDLNLTDQSGLEFVRCLRDKEITTPVVITTAFNDQETLLEAINLEITHYLVKPFKKSDLMNAIHKATKKIAPPTPLPTARKLKNGFDYDMMNKAIIDPHGNTNRLSKKEYLLLELMLSHPNQVVTYEQIESTVWKNTPMSMFALRTLVNAIRKKGYPALLLNASGLGYKFEK